MKPIVGFAKINECHVKFFFHVASIVNDRVLLLLAHLVACPTRVREIRVRILSWLRFFSVLILFMLLFSTIHDREKRFGSFFDDVLPGNVVMADRGFDNQ